MTNTTSETLTVDSVVLNTLAKNISSLTGRLRTPPLRTSNIVIPGRHGAMRPGTRLYAEGQITLPIWVRGCDDNGAVPTTKRRQFYKNVDELTQLFGYHKSTLNIRHTLPDSSVRECFAEVLDPIDFSHDSNGDPYGLATVTLQLANPFWQDTADITQNISGAAAGTTALTSFAGATALMDDFVIRFTGPINNPTLTAVYDSVAIPTIFATYQDNFGSGQWLEFDCKNFTFNTGGGLGAFAYSKWQHSGGARLFTMFPGKSAGNPQVYWSGGGSMTGTTQLRMVGRRKYLVG